MDDLAVSHFEPGGDVFHVETPHDSLRIGAILMGSLVGNWAAHEHSARALHIGQGGDNAHKHGGVAYIRRVIALKRLADGSTRVETSRDMGGVQLFPSGGFGVDFNKTEVRPTGRRRTDAEALQFFHENSMGASDDEIDAATAFFGGDNELSGGDQDENARRLNRGVCDSQCNGNLFQPLAKDRFSNDDNSEFCAYCFEFERT